MRDNQKASIELMREILRNDYLEQRVLRHVLEEDLLDGTSTIRAIIGQGSEGREGAPQNRNIEGQGVGIVDAFFQGLVAQFSPEYSSLKDIRFVGFMLKGKMDPKRSRAQSLTDAEGEVNLLVSNSERKEFEFIASSRSITASALQATLAAVEYFINSERAFLATHRAVEDARARSRADLVAMFSGRLAQLVQNTSYSQAITESKKRGTS